MLVHSELWYIKNQKGYDPPDIRRGWRILKWYIFWGLNCFGILGEGCISQRGSGTFWSISYDITINFLFNLYFI